MKLLKSVIAIVLVNTLMAASCSKEDDKAITTGGSFSGNWKVATYWDKKDETSKFTGFVFTFNSNGQVTATKAGTSYTGSWGESNSRFNISFSDPVLGNASKNWVKTEKTSTRLKLSDDNASSDEWVLFIPN